MGPKLGGLSERLPGHLLIRQSLFDRAIDQRKEDVQPRRAELVPRLEDREELHVPLETFLCPEAAADGKAVLVVAEV